MTPVQVARNLGGLLRPPDGARPSAQREDRVRIVLAAQAQEAWATGAALR